MSREVDRLAQPANPKKMKVIIASCSRSGTLGLYGAMKVLGFTPYHMVEVVKEGHVKVFQEAIIAQLNRFSGIQRYEKADFDKWMGNFDCAVEIPSYMGVHYLRTYAAEDPDIKFILTERDPGRWCRSVDKTAGYVADLARTFPACVLKYFDTSLSDFLYLNQLLYWAVSDGANPGDPNNDAAMRRNYIEYIQSVKETVPKDRLLVVNLEDGLGWEQICPFLDMPVPDEEYPRGNTPEEFRVLVNSIMAPKFQAAALRLSIVTVPVVGIISYVGWRLLSKSA